MVAANEGRPRVDHFVSPPAGHHPLVTCVGVLRKPMVGDPFDLGTGADGHRAGVDHLCNFVTRPTAKKAI